MGRDGHRRSYRLVLEKTRYELMPYIQIELIDDVVRLKNAYSGVYHLFENSSDKHYPSKRSLGNLTRRLVADFERIDV